MNFDSLSLLSAKHPADKALKSELLALNEKSEEYGLRLSEKEVSMLVEAGHEALAVQERVEFGKSVTARIIEKFMQSSYISQNEYADTIAALIEIFYEAKEESLDLLTDEEVINIMFSFFEKESGGSLEVLRERDMECLCRRIRDAANGFGETDYE